MFWFDYNSSFVNGNIIFFSKSIVFFACSYEDSWNFFIHSCPRYKVCLFSILSKAHIVYLEYLQGIWSSIFVVEEFSGLSAHPSISLMKDSISA